jgi:hypothetical protein
MPGNLAFRRADVLSISSYQGAWIFGVGEEGREGWKGASEADAGEGEGKESGGIGNEREREKEERGHEGQPPTLPSRMTGKSKFLSLCSDKEGRGGGGKRPKKK